MRMDPRVGGAAVGAQASEAYTEPVQTTSDEHEPPDSEHRLRRFSAERARSNNYDRTVDTSGTGQTGALKVGRRPTELTEKDWDIMQDIKVRIQFFLYPVPTFASVLHKGVLPI